MTPLEQRQAQRIGELERALKQCGDRKILADIRVAELETQLSEARDLAHRLTLESFSAAPKEEQEAFLKALRDVGVSPPQAPLDK